MEPISQGPKIEQLRQRRAEIVDLARQHGARNIRVFGSIVRDAATPDSDVDFLVDLESGKSVLDLGALLMDLQDLLGHDVDVVTVEGLRPRIRERVLAEAVPL